VVELLGEAREVADPVAVAVEERLDVRLVDDGVLVPERVLRRGCSATLASVSASAAEGDIDAARSCS
jgi:hypothetical protein